MSQVVEAADLQVPTIKLHTKKAAYLKALSVSRFSVIATLRAGAAP